jgi:hypothetical protein
MKTNRTGLQALINILNGIYSEIRFIEEKMNIRVDEGDFRPRIEYFHDAVRMLTSGNTGDKRLSVEYLSYDVSMLRFIQANPLSRPKGSKLHFSPSTAVVASESPDTAFSKTGSVKSQLMDLYKNYSVLFVALLTENADRDYQSKVNECNEEVENIAVLEHEAKDVIKKRDTAINVEELVHMHIDDPALAQKILAAMGGKKNKILASEAQKKFSEMIKAADKQIKTVEQAHFAFATAQLAIYENAKEVVKKMAMNGLNIVGNFVENAVREATRGAGRGY